MANLRNELGRMAHERDKLKALIDQNPDMADFAAARTERDQLDTEVREAQLRLQQAEEKVAGLAGEREGLLQQVTELNLRVAALRDARDGSQLQQDNEILRRMIDRLNEELKLAQPEIARKKRRAAPGGLVTNIARAALARCIVPDPDQG